MPSSAIMDMIGFASCAYSPSAACATAFMPLVTESATGSPSVSAGS
jgi:hypothetical protein